MTCVPFLCTQGSIGSELHCIKDSKQLLVTETLKHMSYLTHSFTSVSTQTTNILNSIQ